MFYNIAMVDFALYLAILCVVLFLFLLLCVRISVYIEDTCPIGICASRKQVKRRDTMVRQLLYPDQSCNPGLSGVGAPPSDENITDDIICQPYIYRDTYSTGLSGLNIITQANRPLTVAYTEDGQPYDAIVANYADKMDIKFCSYNPPSSGNSKQGISFSSDILKQLELMEYSDLNSAVNGNHNDVTSDEAKANGNVSMKGGEPNKAFRSEDDKV